MSTSTGTDGSLVQTVPIPSGGRYNNIEASYGINLGWDDTRPGGAERPRHRQAPHLRHQRRQHPPAERGHREFRVPLVFGGTKKINSKTTYGLAGLAQPRDRQGSRCS